MSSSLISALKQLAAKPPAALGPNEFALLEKLAQISLVRSKADEARRAGMLEAFVAFGKVFPVDAVGGLCAFIAEPGPATAFCTIDGGAEVLLVAFERACQPSTSLATLHAIAQTLLNCTNCSHMLCSEGTVARMVAAVEGLNKLSVRDTRQPLADLAVCTASNRAVNASGISPNRLSALGVPGIALRLLNQPTTVSLGPGSPSSASSAMQALTLCVESMPAAALSRLIAAGLIPAAMAAWLASPSDKHVVIMGSTLIGMALQGVRGSATMEPARLGAMESGLIRESVKLLRRAPADVVGGPLGTIGECMRDSDAAKDAALAAGTAEAVLQCLNQAMSSRPRRAPPLNATTPEYEAIFNAVQVG